MRVSVIADDEIIHDDCNPENILSGITKFELACAEKVNGVSRYGNVKIRMWNVQFGVELPAEEVAEIVRQYTGCKPLA